MKINTILLWVLGVFVLTNTAVALGVEESGQGMPQAIVPVDRYDFEPLPEGSEVVHNFIIQNKGTAPLIIEKVKTG